MKSNSISNKDETRKNQLDQFFDLSQDLLCIANLDGRFVRISRSYERIFGYTQEELLAGSFMNIVHPDDVEANRGELQKLSQGEVVSSFVCRSRKKNGEYVHIAWAASPASDGMIYCVGRDVTERHVLEIEIQKNFLETKILKDRLSLALRSSGIGVWEWDILKNALVWDDRMYELYGVPKQMFSSAYDAWLQGVHPEDRDRGNTEIQEAIEGKKEFNTQFRVVGIDKRIRHIRAFGMIQRDENEKPLKMTGVNWDITKEKEQELRLQQATQEAKSAAQAKSTFLANMSHEIRTPMNGVIGMTNLLLGSATDPTQIERLKIIQSCGNSLLDLINEVLDFSKLEVDKMVLEKQPFALHSIVSEVADLLSTRASEKGVTLSYRHEKNVPTMILGDVTRFRQILTNLVSNAIKFTEIGSVEISSQATQIKKGAWEIQFSVKDSGIGIPDEVKSKLFQSFSQVDASTTRRFGGSGLGLAISKGLCEKMGGDIWVESENGKGSTFSFTFLAEETELKKIEPTENPFKKFDPEMGKKHPLRILVADDNRTNQLVVIGLLGKLGYQADVAANGKEVLQNLSRASYDLVLMDCHMPEMDGFEATKLILEQFKESRPRIVALTASSMKEDIDRCHAIGMDGFLGKPISIPALVKTLSECKAIPVTEKAS